MSSINQTVVDGRLLRGSTGGRDRQVPNRPEEMVGDVCNTKSKDCLRCISQNINGIDQEANSAKEIGTKNFAKDYKVDILALQQLNVCWSKVSNTTKYGIDFDDGKKITIYQ